MTYAKHPLEVSDLISFWDFQEEGGRDRIAKGAERYRLREMEGMIEREGEGVFGPYSARIKPGQWFNLPREDCPSLNIHGSDAQVTVVAWIKWNHDQRCQAVAGMWNETRKKRQYALFLNLSGRYDSYRNVHGHVSSVGGPTPGDRYCITYSTGGTTIPFDQWKCIAMSYDGEYSRVYLNGQLDHREYYNPYAYPAGLFDGGEDGSDFTVGSVHAGGRMNNFYGGLIGGIAVYNRALSAQELKDIGAPIHNEG